MPDDFHRYIRQMRYPPLGEEGQRRLSTSRALVCGCGALGTVLANTLVRSGVGSVRIVDRDFVELSNLQRQVLFDEQDVAEQMPKAIAAAEKLRRINSEVQIEPIVADVDHTNIEQFCEGVDAIVDGTDNFEIRFLINDTSVKHGIPWVYGGCLGAEGQTMTILPGETPCLRCLMQECPPPGTTPTCPAVPDAGVPPAGHHAHLRHGRRAGADRQRDRLDRGLRGDQDPQRQPPGRFAEADRGGALGQPHPAGRRRLAAGAGRLPDVPPRRVSLAGRQVGQPQRRALRTQRRAVDPSRHQRLAGRSGPATPGTSVSLDDLARQLEGMGTINRNPFLLRLKVEHYELTVFPDGRAIVGGTDDVAEARTVYAKYIGN